MHLDTRSAAILTFARTKSPDAQENCLVLDESGRIAVVSLGAARLLGRAVEDLQGSPFGMFVQLLERTELEVVDGAGGADRTVVARAAAYPEKPGWTEITFEAQREIVPLAAAVHYALQAVNEAMPAEQSLRVSIPRLPDALVSAKTQSLAGACLASLVAAAGRSEACLAVYGTVLPEGVELILWLTFTNDPAGPPADSSGFEPSAYMALAEAQGVGIQTECAYPVVHIRLVIPVVRG